MNKTLLSCPDCGATVTVSDINGWTISPVICPKCHAMLEVSSDDTDETGWVLTVVDRVEVKNE